MTIHEIKENRTMKKEIIQMHIARCIIVGLMVALIFIAYNYNKELKATKQELADYQADELEIYPCPFCGSEDVELVEAFGWYVRCDGCGGTGPHHSPNDVWDENTKTEAIEWWNTVHEEK